MTPKRSKTNLPPGTLAGGNPTQEKRIEADFYPTPAECTQAFMRDFGWLFSGKVIWEPACGAGAMSVVLQKNAKTVLSSDLYSRGFGVGGVDYLKQRMPEGIQAIVTNPPFSLAHQFIEKSRSHGVPFALLLKGTYWNAKSRLPLFLGTGPLAVCPLTWRPTFVPSRGSSPTLEFCWTVWGNKPEPKCAFFPMEK